MLENVHFTNMGKKFQHSVSLGQEFVGKYRFWNPPFSL